MKVVEYKKEAIAESIAYFSKDAYRQNKANEDLAKILEIVREYVNGKRQSAVMAMNQISHIFPE